MKYAEMRTILSKTVKSILDRSHSPSSDDIYMISGAITFSEAFVDKAALSKRYMQDKLFETVQNIMSCPDQYEKYAAMAYKANGALCLAEALGLDTQKASALLFKD